MSKWNSIDEILNEYNENPKDDNIKKILNGLKNDLKKKGHSYEGLIQKKLENLGFSTNHSILYRYDPQKNDKDEKETEINEFEIIEIDLTASQTKKIDPNFLGFIGIDKLKITFLIEVKSNNYDLENVFRLHQSLNYNNSHDYFHYPKYSFPFSFAVPWIGIGEDLYRETEIERQLTRDTYSDKLFENYNNIIASTRINLKNKGYHRFNSNYSNEGDLVKISNNFKDDLDKVMKEIRLSTYGLSGTNAIYYAIDQVKEFYVSNEVKQNKINLEDEVSEFIDFMKTEYDLTDDEVSRLKELKSFELSKEIDKPIKVPKNFMKEIYDSLKNQFKRIPCPRIFIPVVVYQGNSYSLIEEEDPPFEKNPVVYSLNFRNRISKNNTEYPVFLFNEHNLNNIKEISNFYLDNFGEMRRYTFVKFYSFCIREIFQEILIPKKMYKP